MNFGNQSLLATILLFPLFFVYLFYKSAIYSFSKCWNWAMFNFLSHSQNLWSSYFQLNCLNHGRVKTSVLYPVIKMGIGSPYCGIAPLAKSNGSACCIKVRLVHWPKSYCSSNLRKILKLVLSVQCKL